MAVLVPDLFENLTARQLFIVYNNEPSSQRAKPQLLRTLRQFKVAVLKPRPRLKLGDIAFDETTGTLEFQVTEANRHHPRSLNACMPGRDETAFWVNLIMACRAGQSTPNENAGAGQDHVVSKKLGTLPNAMRNLHALRSFYEPSRVGAPDIMIPGSVSRSPGYFSHTLLLADPDAKAVELAIRSACHWLNVNRRDEEFDSFQFNIFFSGHAGAGNEAGQQPIRDNSYFVLGDGVLSTAGFVESLLENFALQQVAASLCRINLFFDCCFSAALARDFVIALRRQQQAKKSRLQIDQIACSTIHCSSLGDEESFDHTSLDYSCFVSAYLRENSALKVASHHPTMSTVAQWTGQQQHPLVLTNEVGGMKLRFPTLVDARQLKNQPWHLGDIELVERYPEWFFERGTTLDVEWLDTIMLRAHLMRDFCRDKRAC